MSAGRWGFENRTRPGFIDYLDRTKASANKRGRMIRHPVSQKKMPKGRRKLCLRQFRHQEPAMTTLSVSIPVFNDKGGIADISLRGLDVRQAL